MQSEEAKAALEKVKIKSNSAKKLMPCAAADAPLGQLDWTSLLGKGVPGLQVQYGAEEEYYARIVQKRVRGHLQRKGANVGHGVRGAIRGDASSSRER